MAADFGELVAITRAVGDELYQRFNRSLDNRPQLKLGIIVLAVALCVLLAGKTVAWIFSGSAEIPLGQVAGTVLLNGNPVSAATVEFTPEEGSTSYGITDSKGYYRLQYLPDSPGAVTGHHTVRITTYDWQTTENGEKVEVEEKLPLRYNQESTLHADVTSGSQTLDWELTSP